MENTDQRGTGIVNGSEWPNGTVHVDRTGPTEKSSPPRKVDRFFRNFSGWTEPIFSVLDRNFRKFPQNSHKKIILPKRCRMESAVRETLASILSLSSFTRPVKAVH